MFRDRELEDVFGSWRKGLGWKGLESLQGWIRTLLEWGWNWVLMQLSSLHYSFSDQCMALLLHFVQLITIAMKKL